MYTKKIVDGCVEKTVTYDKRLKYCPYGSCGVVFNANGIHLISYTTCVCSIDNEGYLSCTGTYSVTTQRHIREFLKEYAPVLCYQDVKKAYLENYVINIHTGEILNNPKGKK